MIVVKQQHMNAPRNSFLSEKNNVFSVKLKSSKKDFINSLSFEKFIISKQWDES